MATRRFMLHSDKSIQMLRDRPDYVYCITADLEFCQLPAFSNRLLYCQSNEREILKSYAGRWLQNPNG